LSVHSEKQADRISEATMSPAITFSAFAQQTANPGFKVGFMGGKGARNTGLRLGVSIDIV
jgi:hypothetical protein